MKSIYQPQRNSRRIALKSLLLATALFPLIHSAHAVDYLWDGGGTGDGWGAAGNWDMEGAPTFDADNGFIFYAPDAARLNNFLGNDRTIGTLTFNADADNDVTINLQNAGTIGLILTLGGGVVAPSINVEEGALGNFAITNVGTVAGSVTLASNLTVNHNGTGNFSITRPINGATFGITKNGTGTLSLSGANSYTGGTRISGGTLQISTFADGGSNSAIGASNNAAQNLILDGGTLRYTGSSVDTNRLFALRSSSTIDASGTGAVNFNNAGAMGFNTVTGTRTLTLTGTHTGNNTIAAVIGDNAGATSITKTGTGTWVLSGNNSYTGRTLIAGGTLEIPTLANGVSNSAIGASTNLAASLILDGGTLRYTGGAVETDRLFALSSSSTIDASGTGAVNFTNPGNMGFNATNVSRTLTLAGSNTGNNTLAAVINNRSVSNITSLTKTGTGTWVLGAINNYTGETHILAGTLTLGVPDCLANTNVIIGTGTLNLPDSITDTVGTLAVIAGATIQLGTDATIAFAASHEVDWTGGALNLTGAFVPGASLKFGGSDSALTDTQLGQITATGWTNFDLDTDGYLTATPVTGTPYENWVIGNEVFNDDTNGDGVDNGLAWILGAEDPDVSALDRLPKVSTPEGFLQLEFTRENPIAPAKLTLEFGNDLSGWTQLEIPQASGTIGDDIEVTIDAGTPDSITIKIPDSHAEHGKLFARLSATEN
jgi:autotransporter-associated beta strand protein